MKPYVDAALRICKGAGWAALFLALLTLALPARAEVVASGVTFSGDSQSTRFVLELSKEPDHRIFSIDGPARLVIDLDGVDFQFDEPASATGLVSAWRFGALSPSRGRIVFDLRRPAKVDRRFFLPPLAGKPGRLVLDLSPTDAARFEAVARSAQPVAEGRETPVAPPEPGGPVIVIDPGHGGVDPGAVTQSGLEEKAVTLAFAKRLAERLQTIDGLTVRLTRGDDRFLSLNRRIRIARAYGADLFLSIHADAAPQDYVRGATVYTLSERASDGEAAALAARENLADSVSGVIEPDSQEDVSGILADLMRRETKAFSQTFSNVLTAALKPRVAMNVNPQRSARFRVLMAHDIPSVLLELGYLTNARDTEALLRPEWQEKAIEGIVAAVEAYLADPKVGLATARSADR